MRSRNGYFFFRATCLREGERAVSKWWPGWGAREGLLSCLKMLLHSWQQKWMQTKLVLAVSASQHQAKVGARSHRRRHLAAREQWPRLQSWWLGFLCPWTVRTSLCVLAGECTCQTAVPSADDVSVFERKAAMRPLPQTLVPSPLSVFCRLPKWLDLWCGKGVMWFKGEKNQLLT